MVAWHCQGPLSEQHKPGYTDLRPSGSRDSCTGIGLYEFLTAFLAVGPRSCTRGTEELRCLHAHCAAAETFHGCRGYSAPPDSAVQQWAQQCRADPGVLQDGITAWDRHCQASLCGGMHESCMHGQSLDDLSSLIVQLPASHALHAKPCPSLPFVPTNAWRRALSLHCRS